MKNISLENKEGLWLPHLSLTRGSGIVVQRALCTRKPLRRPISCCRTAFSPPVKEKCMTGGGGGRTKRGHVCHVATEASELASWILRAHLSYEGPYVVSAAQGSGEYLLTTQC